MANISDALPTIGTSFVFFSLLYPVSSILSPLLAPSLYAPLPKGKQMEWHGRVAAILMAVVAVSMALPEYLNPGPELLADPVFGQSERARLCASFVVGYFAWDILFCVWGQQGSTYTAHAVLCLGVYLLCLTPFIQHIAMFFLCFELSTPLLHVRTQLIACKRTDSLFFSVVQILFCLTFLVVRIGFGLPISAMWWLDMLQLVNDGTAPSLWIVGFFMVANVGLCSLNCLWGFKIVQGLLKSVRGDYVPKESEHHAGEKLD